MSQIFFGFLIFSFAAIAHVFLYRLLTRLKIKSFRSVLIFAAGFLILISANFGTEKPTPLSGGILYIFLTGIYLVYFGSVYIGEESPSADIFAMVKKEKELTKAEIRNKFSDRIVIGKRLENLIDSGLVSKRGENYKLSGRGNIIAFLFDAFRQILGWRQGG